MKFDERVEPMFETKTSFIYDEDIPALLEQAPEGVQGFVMGCEYMSAEGVRLIAQSPRLSELRYLILARSKFGDEIARLIAESPVFTNLRYLYLNDCEIGDAGVRYLANSAILANLRHLYLDINRIGPDGAKALAHSLSLSGLTRLHVTGNPLGDEGVLALAASSSRLANLEELQLRFHDMGPKALSAVLNSDRLSALTSLVLEGDLAPLEALSEPRTTPARLLRLLPLFGHKGPEVAQQIAASPHVAALRALQFYRTETIGDKGLIALANSPYLTNLEELTLFSNGIGDAGAKALATSRYVTNLRKLDLRENDVGEAGLKAMAASPGLARLEELDLYQNKLGDTGESSGIVALANSPHLAALKRLRLASSYISIRGALDLIHSPYLQNIEMLDLSGCGLYEEAEIWYDQGYEVGGTPARPEAKQLRERFGDRLRL